MVVDVLVSIGWEWKWLAPSVRPEPRVMCDFISRDVRDVEDGFVLAKGSFYSTGDGVDVG